jgi:hypothetical protein
MASYQGDRSFTFTDVSKIPRAGQVGLIHRGLRALRQDLDKLRGEMEARS